MNENPIFVKRKLGEKMDVSFAFIREHLKMMVRPPTSHSTMQWMLIKCQRLSCMWPSSWPWCSSCP